MQLAQLPLVDGDNAKDGLRAMETQASNGQHSRECGPAMTLMVSQPPEMRIHACEWSRRAWAFQERLLSPRTLVFVHVLAVSIYQYVRRHRQRQLGCKLVVRLDSGTFTAPERLAAASLLVLHETCTSIHIETSHR
jgi:hypothetical protein